MKETEAVPEGTLTCAASATLDVKSSLQRTAFDFLQDMCVGLRLKPRGELNVCGVHSSKRSLFHLLSADVAFFIVWDGGFHPAGVIQDAVAHALLYSKFAAGRGLLLIESDDDQMSTELRAARRIVDGSNVDVREFAWRSEHADAAYQYFAGQTKELPKALEDPHCLTRQIFDWIDERQLAAPESDLPSKRR